MKALRDVLPETELATEVAKLWPHREHESNIILAQLCHVGVHRWRRLDLAALVPGRDICHCFRCSKVRIDGLVYDP